MSTCSQTEKFTRRERVRFERTIARLNGSLSLRAQRKARAVMKRGAVKAKESELVALWLPKPLVEALDFEVTRTDLDRSKLIRAALREKLARAGVRLEVAS